MTKKIPMILISSIFCTLLTLIAPKNVHTTAQMSAVESGWPFSYITQNITAVNRELPHRLFFASPWENPTDFDVKNFIASLLFFAAISICVTLAHERAVKRK